jgi:hypothetical protein
MLWVMLLHQLAHGIQTINESKKVNGLPFSIVHIARREKKVSLHLPNDVFPTTPGNAGVMAQQEKARANGRFACQCSIHYHNQRLCQELPRNTTLHSAAVCSRLYSITGLVSIKLFIQHWNPSTEAFKQSF